MKKISLLIALALIISIAGVYATWTYTQSTDVADETVNMSLNLTNVTYTGTYGTYEIDKTGLNLTIDPKEGTSHTTALKAGGSLIIKFTPNTYAPEDIKQNAVPSTYSFSLSNNAWTYDGASILTLQHADAHDIDWVSNDDGSFSYVISAADLSSHFSLTEFNLDTKADYDAYNAALAQGQIQITVSDGVTSQS